jgi:hypothetical protein
MEIQCPEAITGSLSLNTEPPETPHWRTEFVSTTAMMDLAVKMLPANWRPTLNWRKY